MAQEPDNVIDYGATDASQFTSGTGDANIDGLLSGRQWDDFEITFSYPDSDDDFDNNYASTSTTADPAPTFSAFNGKQETAAEFWLDQYAAVSGLTFVELDGADGALDEDQEATLRFANSADPSTAYAWSPRDNEIGGDMWFGPDYVDPDRGDRAWRGIGHELGHALGLKHGNESGGISGAMDADRDSMEFSIMTARSYVGDSPGFNNQA